MTLTGSPAETPPTDPAGRPAVHALHDRLAAAVFDDQIARRRAARGRLPDPGVAHGDGVTDGRFFPTAKKGDAQ